MSIIKNDFEKMNITKIKNSKNNKKLTVITAYDALFAKLLDIGDFINCNISSKSEKN